MKWYIAVENELKEIPEEVLIYKIQNGEISLDTFVANDEIKKWIPLKNTKIYKEQCNVKNASGMCFSSNASANNEVAKVKKNKVTEIAVAVSIIMVIVLFVFQISGISSGKNSLVGEWKLDNHSSMTFFKNGTALWESDDGSQTFEWDVNGNIMTWYFGVNSYRYTWKIKNNNLYVNGEYYATRRR